MIKVRRSQDRGFADHGWLKSRHTFSFADYHDPEHMGYSVLRVINEDRINGGTGFDTHAHSNMEIVSYVVEGALEHRDSTGTLAVIIPGEVQRMSAGTGVRHSEYNAYKDETTHFLQIWIHPAKDGLKPSYDQKTFESLGSNALVLVGSPNGENGSVVIHQDVKIYACKTTKTGAESLTLKSDRHLWLQIIAGSVEAMDQTLLEGDGAAIEGVRDLSLKWSSGCEFLLFDLP